MSREDESKEAFFDGRLYARTGKTFFYPREDYMSGYRATAFRLGFGCGTDDLKRKPKGENWK